MEWRRVWLFVRKGRRRTTYCLRWYDDVGRVRTESVASDKMPADAVLIVLTPCAAAVS